MGKPFKQLKNNVIYVVARVAIAAWSILPLSVSRALGRGLGALAWAVAGRERRRAIDNISHSDLALSAAERRRLVRRCFLTLGGNAAECLSMQRLGSRLHGSVEFADGSLDVLEAARDRKKGVIFVTGHVGNFELLASVVARRVPLSVLARKSYDPRFSRLIERFRGASSVETIWVDERSHLLQAASALREGRVLGVLLDQPTQAQSGLAVPFFGRPAPTSAIAASLARSTGAALVCGFIVRRADGRQVVSISAVGMADGARDQQQLATTARLTAEIERVIRAHPDQWLWTLDRWRGRGRTA